MNPLLKTIAVFLFVLCSSQVASGAIVTFMGDLTAGGPGILGSIPGDPATLSYFSSLEFDEGFGTTLITGGTFASAGRSFDVSEGFISIQDRGVDDNATIFANLSGPSEGILALSLNGDAISSEIIDSENLNRFLLLNSFPDPVTVSFANGNGSYSGNVTGVPEPSSGLMLLSIVLGSMWRRKRNEL